MHRLLRRQLAKYPLSVQAPEGSHALLQAVDAAYHEADADRELLERSLDLTSSELLGRNQQLREDVEARTRAERALRHSDARTRAILGALPDLMFVSSDTYRVVEWHARDPKGFGVRVQVDEGQSLEGVFPSAAVLVLVRLIDDALASDRPCSCEYQLEVAGETREYAARAARCDASSAVVMVRDTTDQARLQERLRVADRMASIGTLAAGIAHEINNPLAYVLTNLDVLAEALCSSDSSAEIRAIIDESREGASRVQAIVRDLKIFCHPSPGGDGRADVRRVLESSLRLAANEIRHRARVVVEIGDLPAAIGDESRLGQVFLNLLSNAAQAIGVGNVASNEILVVARAQGSSIIVEISDTGSGLPHGSEARIFDPFVTTKPVGVGTGLGLSICRRIVTALGGEIVAFARRPRGSTFRVTLPAAQTGRAAVAAGSTVVPVSTPPARVLVIDDDAMVASALARGLRPHEVHTNAGPADAVARLLAGETFDVILCDVMMPECSGVEVYEAVVRERPELASTFIFMSGGVFSPREIRFLEGIPNARVDKPFAIAEVREIVGRHVSRQAAARIGSR